MIILERRQKPSSFILPNICKEHSGPGGLAVQLAAGWCARMARLTGDCLLEEWGWGLLSRAGGLCGC